MDTKTRVQDIAEQAIERVSPVIDEAREKIVPAAEAAADTAKTTFNESVVPQAAALLAAASAASEPYREEAKRRGAATLAAVKGEVEAAPPPQKSHKLRNFVLLAALGGAIAYLVKRFTGDDSAAWESNYRASGPTPVPDLTTPSAAEPADDAAAAGPDEALADAAEQPHQPTNPESPLERKDV
jgi:hypothetical protein